MLPGADCRAARADASVARNKCSKKIFTCNLMLTFHNSIYKNKVWFKDIHMFQLHYNNNNNNNNNNNIKQVSKIPTFFSFFDHLREKEFREESKIMSSLVIDVQ